MEKEKTVFKDDSDTDLDEGKHLIVHNDEIHSFDYVIDVLTSVCGHTTEQAIQCTYIIHNKGKCEVKKGTYDSLKIMKDQIIQLELGATIE